MKIPFAYYQDDSGLIKINYSQSETVSLIYGLYLKGKSLNSISDFLHKNSFLSPTGKSSWTVQSIDNLLSNKKYIPIVGSEIYFDVQFEKERRTNKSENGTRKTTRYNSSNVLSGLLVCGECGSNYRRITRKNGEIVWRCADKVEHGRNSSCNNTRTVTDQEIKNKLCEYLGLAEFDENTVKSNIDRVEITGSDIQYVKSKSRHSTLSYSLLSFVTIS